MSSSNLLIRVLIFLGTMAIPLLSQTPSAPSAGDGTSGNPYQISSLGNLYWIAADTNRWKLNYVQTADINAGATKHWFNDSGWTPIGNNITAFTGNYNGKSYKIDSLFINRDNDYIGMFGSINGSRLDSIGLTNLNVKGNLFVGGLVAIINTGVVNKCYSTGSVNGTQHVGGLVGSNHQTCSVCNNYSTSSVNGSSEVGGLVGSNDTGVVTNNYSSGSVVGSSYVGGLVGKNNFNVSSNYSFSSVTGSKYVGGLVGYNSENFLAVINNSYSCGPVNKTYLSGGLVGLNNNINSTHNCFWDSTTAGQDTSEGGTGKTTAEMKNLSTYINAGWDFMGESVNGTTDTWGLNSKYNSGYPFLKWQGYKLEQNVTYTASTLPDSVTYGDNSFSITVSTSSGLPVTITSSDVTVASIAGNTVAIKKPGTTTITMSQNGNDTYYPTQISKVLVVRKARLTVNAQVITKQEGQADPKLTYSATGYVGNDTVLNGSLSREPGEYVGNYAINQGTLNSSSYIITFTGSWLKITISQQPSAGDGSSGNPYRISTLGNLYWIAEDSSRWEKNYIQTANINAAVTKRWFKDSGWTPIGKLSTCFTGTYNGKGHLIDSLYIQRDSLMFAGMFGSISTSHLDSIGLTNLNIKGKRHVGGLAGASYKNSTISNSFSTGSISGLSIVGGLAGDNDSSTITNCYSSCSVNSSRDYAGGLVSYNNMGSTISSSYSSGLVSCPQFAGGLLGYKEINSNVNNSFWDIESSIQSSSAGGTGKTTAEMKNITTYTNDGWDFMGETVNGTSDIWGINGKYNSGYPFLKWQGYKLEQTVSFTCPDSVTYGDASFTISSTSLSGLPVVFSSSNLSVAEITGNTVVIKGAGLTTITATQNGNDNYYSASVSKSLKVGGQSTAIRRIETYKTYNNSKTGIFIRSNPVALSSGKADIRILTGYPSDLRIIIYDAVGNAVLEKDESSFTGTVDMNWNFYTQSGHRAGCGTYLIVAKVKSRVNGTTKLLTTKQGLKQE